MSWLYLKLVQIILNNKNILNVISYVILVLIIIIIIKKFYSIKPIVFGHIYAKLLGRFKTVIIAINYKMFELLV